LVPIHAYRLTDRVIAPAAAVQNQAKTKLPGYPKMRNIDATKGLMTLKDTNRVPMG
jgi:hypothetical protein